MSLMSAIRAATRGTGTPRLEEEKPEEMEEDAPAPEEEDDTAAEADEENDPDPEEAEAEPAASEDEDEKSMSTRDRNLVLGEQRRIAAILTHPSAEANPNLAAKLAFSADHRMSTKRACDLLASGGQAKGVLGNRMRGNSPRIGAGSGGRAPNERQLLVAGVRDTIQAMHGRKSKEG